MKNVSLKELVNYLKINAETRGIKILMTFVLFIMTWVISSKAQTNESSLIEDVIKFGFSGITAVLMLDCYLKLYEMEFIHNLKQINFYLSEQYIIWTSNSYVSLQLDPSETAHKKNLYYLILNSNYFYFKLKIPKLLNLDLSKIDKNIFDFEHRAASMSLVATMEGQHKELIKLRKDAWFKDTPQVLNNEARVNRILSLVIMTILFSFSVIIDYIPIYILLFMIMLLCLISIKVSKKNYIKDFKNYIIKEDFLINDSDAGALVSLKLIMEDEILERGM